MLIADKGTALYSCPFFRVLFYAASRAVLGKGIQMEKWFVASKKADFDSWALKYHVSPVIARILRNRDLTEDEEIVMFLRGTLEDCHSPFALKDMDRAVNGILEAVECGRKIRVIGDYDVDGICASYILTKGLQKIGANVDTAIPHRIHDGYGLNENLIKEAVEDGVELIITCDNGIAARAQIALAREKGIDVIVTDHHEVPYEEGTDGERRELLPDALAVVDPKQQACTYPFKGICGGVVALKVIEALALTLGDGRLEECMDEFLEFAALATVCDVMELKDENRIFVKEGLKRLRTTGNPGLKALMEVNGIDAGRLNAYHLGFVIGPCLNATGRLDSAKRALELLYSKNPVDAMSTAAWLKELNDSRKNLTLEGVQAAEEQIEKQGLNRDKVMVVYLPKVHESLAGIIAGRIREKYNHPVFVLTKGEECVKGSGRSIEGYHMYEGLCSVGEFLEKFGGHAMAAGLSIKEENIELFRTGLNEGCSLTEEDFVPKIHIDIPMPLGYAGDELADELEILEPFGVGNPKPLFAQKDVVFLSGTRMGNGNKFARFRVKTPEGRTVQLVFFGDLERFEAFLNDRFGGKAVDLLFSGKGDFRLSVTYQIGKNSYRGHTEIQYLMQNYC